ncbi:hypothetical protein CA603_05605 [Paraburkholderia hospita]|nr:hypothetical protein CA603_05605 [Paraburkholderia hospita]
MLRGMRGAQGVRQERASVPEAVRTVISRLTVSCRFAARVGAKRSSRVMAVVAHTKKQRLENNHIGDNT